MDRTEIIGSRGKTFIFLVGSIAAVAIALFLGKNDQDSGLKWAAAFFSVCSATFAWTLIRPQKLILEPDGFSLAGGIMRKPYKVPWRDVSGFFVVSVARGTKMVGYNFTPDAASRRRGPGIARRISGADGGLHGIWPPSTANIVDELNDYRQKALSKSGRKLN